MSFKFKPFEFIIDTSRKCGAFYNFTHLFSTKTEVVNCPDITEFNHFHL